MSLTAVLYLHAQTAEWFDLKKNLSTRWGFPAGAVSFGEVIDSETLRQELTKGMTAVETAKGKVLVVLAPELTFHQQEDTATKMTTTLPEGSELPAEQTASDSLEKPKSSLVSFLALLPLEPETTAVRLQVHGAIREVWATNRELFEVVMNVLKAQNFTPVGVVPILADLPNTSPTTILSSDDFTQLANFKEIGKWDFSTAASQPEVLASLAGDSQKGQKSKLVLLAATAVILLLVILGGGFLKQKVFMKPKIQPVAVAPQPSPQATLEPSPSPLLVSKAVAKIQIFNGSGVPGQAGKLKDALIKKGFTSIEVGNAASASAKTLASFRSNLDPAVQTEVLEVLKPFSPKQTPETVLLSADASFDVVIVTGK
jgi:hypothetical protein